VRPTRRIGQGITAACGDTVRSAAMTNNDPMQSQIVRLQDKRGRRSDIGTHRFLVSRSPDVRIAEAYFFSVVFFFGSPSSSEAAFFLAGFASDLDSALLDDFDDEVFPAWAIFLLVSACFFLKISFHSSAETSTCFTAATTRSPA